jgi:hypothetical protein
MDIKKLPIRLIVSVIAGIATAMILSVITRQVFHLLGLFPKIGEPEFETNLLLIALGYHSIYAIIASMVTAHMAKERARKAAFLLGSKEAIMWVLGMILLWKHAAPWYNLSKAILGIPLAMLGAKLYQAYKRRKEETKQKELQEQKENIFRHYYKRATSLNQKMIRSKQV